MRAVVVERAGGPEVLVPTELPDPVPGPGELLVRLAVAGVNYKDVYERQAGSRATPPFVPGSEGAGTVLALGPGAEGFAVGDRVAWWAAPGSYAEQVIVPAAAAVPVPEDITAADAAAVLLQGLTAHYLTTSVHPAAKGETALVHSAAGGLGRHLTRLLTAQGVRVLATVSAPEKVEAARAAGAQEVLVRAEGGALADGGELAARVRELTDGRGVDVVYDGIGRDTFEAGLGAVRRRGLFVLVGSASGPAPALDPQSLASRGSLFLTRPTLVDYATDPDELRFRAAEVFDWLRDGRLELAVGGRYPLAEAARAHADLQSRRTTGKLLLLPS
ncbi:quinone oxidoreductase [Streptomyces sp. LX-29]|uniref:quinone oxidoreductase family protein n=1 Tax=Streptomyces sp. LX-29 TaxID=2900152 RepID=UPI00240CFAF8|nr:quinone oxidoreductase [Streptomyces sp. LX-29]WFB09675.1 quinone oxidoreductase [Streptomyces sp. LX-29]